MSIAAINEHLLRSIGVGVAIVRASDLSFIFYYRAFAEWFEVSEEHHYFNNIVEGLTAEKMQ